MPTRTTTVAARSSRERGRIAERTPSGNAIISQKTAPPTVSARVTGSVSRMMSLTGRRET
jgi:hypothetical protein